ncbi:cytochrome o ubiquinol oxidase subunit III [Candidatus Sororendozoicomonas aggregata]|uniref:cytochrome o ubiquinol oxidase subunit III n=1 Tax=Candidatus Sororendozoicomonas aggregata TaxID=3073239 RepID=UPI002ECFD160
MSADVLTYSHDVDDHSHDDSKTTFGFWVYLLSDCILFASIFATYAVLHENTFGGPGAKELFDMFFVLVETIILLTSSFTYGLAILAMHRGKKRQVLGWLVYTFLLGVAFLGMELYEFHHLVESGNSWQRSAFLSSFFTLVGTHGLHVFCGLIWMMIMMIQVRQHGLNNRNATRLTCLSLFWHFLDIIWICVFTIVYLMGAI